MSSNLFTPSLRYTNKDTCNSAWTFIDGQNVSDIEVPKFIKNLFTSFDDSRYGKMGKDLIEGAGTGDSCSNDEDCTDPNNLCKLSSDPTQACPSEGQGQECACVLVDPGGDPCSTNPCQHGGTCTSDGSSHTCDCPTGYTGDNCETEPPPNTCTTAYGGSTETGVNHPCNVYGLLTKDKYSGPITNYPQWYEPIKEPDNTDNPDTSNTSALSANNFNTCCGKSSWKNYCTLDNWDNSDVVSYLTGLGCPLFADSQ